MEAVAQDKAEWRQVVCGSLERKVKLVLFVAYGLSRWRRSTSQHVNVNRQMVQLD